MSAGYEGPLKTAPNMHNRKVRVSPEEYPDKNEDENGTDEPMFRRQFQPSP